MKTLSATDTLVAAPEDGASVTVTSITYATSTDGTTPPSSGWTTGIPTVPEGSYLWTKIAFSSGDPAYMVSRQMKNGTSVTVSSVKYAVGSSATTHPTSGWSTTFPSSIGQGKYLWIWTVYSDGTSAYSVSFQGNDGENVTVVSTAYAVSTSGTTIPSSGWSATIPSVPKGSYLWTRVEFSNGEYSYTCAYHGKDGSPGSTGPSGPLPYPCGSYDSTVSYTRDAFKCPVVELDSIYYGMKKAGTVTGVNPKTDVANNGGNWEVFDMFKWLMSEVAFINFGKLASAIFYGQYMFSQYGIDADGAAVTTASGYKDFNYSDPMNAANAFRPNILFDFLRGKAWMNDVSVKGDVNATSGEFNNVEFQSGKVAGFNVEGNSIVNSGFDNDASVIFRNDTYKTFAGIGGNVLPASTGLRAVARFENHDTTDQWGFAANYAMLLSAQGGHDNVALGINGGCIYGMAMKNTIIGTSVTSKTLERSDYNVLAINTSECTLTLPTMQLYDDGHVIRIKRLGSGGLKIKLGYCYTWNGTSYRYTRPILVYDRNSTLKGTDTLPFESICDCFELVWCRDLSYTIDGTTYYGAWIQYKLPRDW